MVWSPYCGRNFFYRKPLYYYLIFLDIFFWQYLNLTLQVQPASGFASQIKEHNGKVAIFDINPPNKHDDADFLFLGSCDVTLPEIFDLKTEVESLAR